ncbi:MAG: hypothetical protein AB1443_07210 [Pseudomonadota bacterium]
MIAKIIASLLLTCILVLSVRAETNPVDSSLTIRGFGTVGLARSSSDHAEFVRDLSQPVGIKGGQWSGRIDSILGLQANWRATHELEFVGQVVSRLHYDRSHNPEVMWAFAKWEPDPRFSFRAGRIGADFMMLADSRLVGYSYLTVRPPTDFFGPLFFSHFDGADVSGTLPIGDGLVRGKLFAGKTQEKSAGTLGVWDTSGSPVGGLVLDYVTGPWHVRLNSARIRFAADMNVSALTTLLQVNNYDAAAESLLTQDKSARFLSFGVAYDRGPLQLQGMLNRIRQESAVFQSSHAGYLLAAYRIGSVTPFMGVSRWKTQPHSNLPVVGDVFLDSIYSGFVAGSKIDRTTYSLGARWDVHRQIALKLQWDAVRASRDTGFSFANVTPAWNGKTDILTATMDFVF